MTSPVVAMCRLQLSSTVRERPDMRGPAFVTIDGKLYVNVAFDLPPLGPDPRVEVGRQLDVPHREVVLLRRLTAAEAKRVRRAFHERNAEAWASITQ